MNSAEAFAAIALAAVSSDGTLERNEAQALRRQLEDRSIYSSFSELAMGEMFDNLLKKLRDQGVNGLIDSALPSLNIPQQESALAVAAYLINADRIVNELELEFLNRLASKTNLPDGEATAILKAIEALHRQDLD